ncbi:gamma-tubulin complex component 6 [Anguilla rostrata]|uniref:gamma-tubulin complex component 6 n=1 Tax=Anguilla rostrata TaxID=7938 RepID=UPI0030CCC860
MSDRLGDAPSASCSITGLLGALCDTCISGVSWKRRASGAASREAVRRDLRKRAYGALLSELFREGPPNKGAARPDPLASTPARNKVLMISFDLRVAGRQEEAQRLEELLGSLGGDSGLVELDSVLELLVRLAGSVPPPAPSFSRDYMRRERPVTRRRPLEGYVSEELARLEVRARDLVWAEEWGALGDLRGALGLMDAPPGTGLFRLGGRGEGEERFERETRTSLFGALQHSRTSDLDVRLDPPPVPSNADVTGLAIRVPPCLDQSEDEGFQSASNLTPVSQWEPSPGPEPDVWEALPTFVPGRRRCWEGVGWPPGSKEDPYLTEAGREAFDQLYRLWEGGARSLSSDPASPPLPAPQDCQTQLVGDLLNVLIGVASATFPLNQACAQFEVRPGVCISGASPESASRLLGDLAQYGTHYLRLSRFSLQSAQRRGLVFQAFTGGLRRYLQYYRACVLSTHHTLSLLSICFLFRKLGRQLRYLTELCCVDGVSAVNQATFPGGVKLLSYLYNEAQSNCSNENYPVLLSLLKSSCEPYTRFVSDWVYSGVFRDVYGEFMIQVNEDYLGFRDKHFWSQGYTLISHNVEECVPVFLRHIASDVYICGKTINLLKICCPQHYICWSELPVPRIAVTFSLQEVEEIERDCAVYRGRVGMIAKHSAVSREEQWRNTAKRKEQEDEFGFIRELQDREKRLQALEEQLERRARKELLDQYARLTEEATRRERRAVWRVQRLRLDESRARFLREEQRLTQALLERYPLGQPGPPPDPPTPACAPQPAQVHPEKEVQDAPTGPEDTPTGHKDTPTGPQDTPAGPQDTPTPAGDDVPILDAVDIRDFLPKPPRPLDSQEVDRALQDIGSDLPETAAPPASAPPLTPTPGPDYDFSAPYVPLEGPHPSPRWDPAVPPLVPVQDGEKTSEAQGDARGPGAPPCPPPGPDQEGQRETAAAQPVRQEGAALPKTSESVDTAGAIDDQAIGRQPEKQPLPSHPTCREENFAPEEVNLVLQASTHEPASQANVTVGVSSPSPAPHSHASNAHIRVGDHVSEVITPLPTPSIHGHASDAHIRVGEHMSEVTAFFPTPSIHGHASDAHIMVGEHVSEVTACFPTPSIHGHASDAHIRVGEHVSEVTAFFPTPSIHGHASDAHIRVGEHISEVTAFFPTPSIHGHASDAHIRVGEHVSEVTAFFPTPSIHGHASDAHIRVGEHVSEVTAFFPTPSIHGHASDAHIRVGEHVSEVVTFVPTPSIHGHASDAHIRVGEHVSEVVTFVPTPSIHGHASDSSIKVGGFVSDVTPFHPRWSKHGHSSDSALMVGCVVSGTEPLPSPLPGSGYGHSSDSALGSGCVTMDSRGLHTPLTIEELEAELEAGAHGEPGRPPEASPDGGTERDYLAALAAQYEVEQYQDSYSLMALAPDSQLLQQVTGGPYGLPGGPSLGRATDATAVQLSELVSLPVLMKHSVTTPIITHVSLVNKAVVDYFFVELGVERHFEALRHFLLMEDGEFAQSLSDLLFEKLGSGQTPGELLTPLVLNSILSKALQYSLHGDSALAANFTFALRFLPETFHPLAPDALNCLELRYKVDWPLNIIITDSCMNKYNRLFSFLLQLKHMVWTLRDVWFHLKRAALVKGAGSSVQFRQLQLFRHEMQHFVKVIQGYIANQILQVSWSEFTHKLGSASDLDAIHHIHADYLNRAIFRGLLTEKAASVMNIIHSIFSLILKFRAQLIAQPWSRQQGELVHPSFVALQQSYNTFKYYSHFLFKVVTKLVNRGYQPHLEDFLVRINFNNYYKEA